jgi:hypothetical protein
MPAEVMARCALSVHKWVERNSLLAVRVMMEHMQLQHRQRLVNVGCGFKSRFPLIICATRHNLMDVVKYLIDECHADINVVSINKVSS